MTILSLPISDQQLAIFKQAAEFRHVSLDEFLIDMIAKTTDIEKERLEREDWNRRFLALREHSTLEVGEITWKREDLYDR